jgi:hypothetical protein
VLLAESVVPSEIVIVLSYAKNSGAVTTGAVTTGAVTTGAVTTGRGTTGRGTMGACAFGSGGHRVHRDGFQIVAQRTKVVTIQRNEANRDI